MSTTVLNEDCLVPIKSVRICLTKQAVNFLHSFLLNLQFGLSNYYSELFPGSCYRIKCQTLLLTGGCPVIVYKCSKEVVFLPLEEVFKHVKAVCINGLS